MVLSFRILHYNLFFLCLFFFVLYTLRVLCLLSLLRQPYPETGFAYYAFCSGEGHEAAANSLSEINDTEGEREQLRLAVASYKFGACLSSQAGAELTVNYVMRSRVWDCLGLAIRRYAASVMDDDNNGSSSPHLVYFDMAERAYRWALACLYPFQNRTNFNTHVQNVLHNLKLCMHFRNKSALENVEASSGSMKDQRKKMRKEARAGAMLRDGHNVADVAHISKHMCSQCNKTTGQDGQKLRLCVSSLFRICCVLMF